ncbi:unnamed protein product [Hymenolepis diminuta]|uniref:TldD/PmbA family protein n=1 Tax=Hymenolepis diminuta TaxID=6216 RepID=A0A0R3SY84_HYMDI|nr:unnamed protein product [Hymenolepis diminuta]VUZ40625.1 unnamed protein product [Hymenolepis diminuta]
MTIAKRGTGVYDDKEVKSFNEFFTVSDAVRRSIGVEAEGVEKRVTVDGSFCSSGVSNKLEGCFIDTDNGFTSFIDNTNSAESKLHLTSHVLAALSSAGTPLKTAKAAQYDKSLSSTIECIESVGRSFPLKEWSTLLIAKVLHAVVRIF